LPEEAAKPTDAAAPRVPPKPIAPLPIGIGGALLATLCAALWGGTVVAIKISIDDIPPFGAAGIRFLLAAGFMVVWCRLKGASLVPRPGQVGPIVITGVLLYAQIGLLNVATNATSSANATLLLNLYPLFVVGLAHFLKLDDQLTKRTVFGMTLALIGVLMVLKAPEAATNALDPTSLRGDLLAVASALVLAGRVLFTKSILHRVESGKLLFWHDLVAVALFMTTSAALEGFSTYRFTPSALLSLLFQGLVVAGFCYAAWTILLQKHRASQLVAFGFITPLCGVLFSHLLRGDALGPALLLGGGGIALGVVVVNTRKDPPGS